MADHKRALAIGAVAVLVRLALAAVFFGTGDVYNWMLLGQALLRGENFYALGAVNWPPLWVYVTGLAWYLHDLTGLPFSPVVKFLPTVADACIAVLLYRSGLRLGWTTQTATRTGLAYALSPVAVLVTGGHGQFDALMVLASVVGWYCWRFWSGRTRLLASGLALGLGVAIKPVPLILLPVFLLRLTSWRTRIAYCGLAIGPAVVTTLPYFIASPEDVTRYFLLYGSWFGQWGYPVLWMLVEFVQSGYIPLPDPAAQADLPVSPPLLFMYRVGRPLLVLALTAGWWYGYKRGLDVLHSSIFVFCIFYFATNGLGVQYLIWILPFALLARDRWVVWYTSAATVLLGLAYIMGPSVYVPPAIPWPPMPIGLREFVVKLASLPVWTICGLWALNLVHPELFHGQGAAQRSAQAPEAA